MVRVKALLQSIGVRVFGNPRAVLISSRICDIDNELPFSLSVSVPSREVTLDHEDPMVSARLPIDGIFDSFCFNLVNGLSESGVVVTEGDGVVGGRGADGGGGGSLRTMLGTWYDVLCG